MAVDEDDFGKQLADAFAEDLEAHTSADSNPNQVTPPAPDPAQVTPPAPNVEEPKPNEPANPEDPNKKTEEPETPPADPANPPEGDPAAPKDPEAPAAEEPPAAAQPLTRDDVADVIRQMRNDDRISSTAVQEATKDVMDAYYPEGLTNTLVDQNTGKELKTPQDVVAAAAAAGNELSMEDAAQWLLNEQYKLDKNIEKIQGDARALAETNLTFRTNGVAAVEKYEPLFKAFEKMGLQQRVFDKMMKFVKADEKKGLILSAPDPLEFYDDYLEPYVTAFEHSKQQSATNPTPPAADPAAPPAPPKPGQQDRMDEGGDGGQEPPDNPNDFAQQVTKELNNPWG